jgi:apolipoprotein N-acyltransferase
MARRRHAVNPAKYKADLQSIEERPPPEVFEARLNVRRRWSVLLLSLLSSVLLLVSFPPYDLWPLAYVALVPWGLAVVGARSVRWALFCSFLAGVVFWAVGLYWLTWVTLVGYLPLILYLAVYWLAAAAAVRRAFLRRVPTWIALPVAWVTLEFARAYLLSGFPWFFLAHTQYRRLAVIQAADLGGPYLVSFFVGLVNGVIVDLMAQPLFVRRTGRARPTRAIAAALIAAVAAAGLMLGYGAFRLSQETTEPGPRIGVVQMAFPISLFRQDASNDEIFRGHFWETQQLAEDEADCDLVVWPEGMIAHYDFNPARWAPLAESIDRYRPETQARIRDYLTKFRRLNRLLIDLDCPLLAGAPMPIRYTIPEENETIYCNSMVMYRPGPRGLPVLVDRYDKMHPVPFGEYVPFRESWPWLHRRLRSLVPEPMPQLEPGRKVVRFRITGPAGRRVRLATPICYEGVFARDCRRLVDKPADDGADMIVNASNDGWFIYLGRKYIVAGPAIEHASTELEQHLSQYVFRAIENRVPVVRAVNTGISASINSDGGIEQTVSHQGKQKMVAGRMVAQTLVDRRISPYSLVGDVFAIGVCLAFAGGLVWLIWPRRAKGKE